MEQITTIHTNREHRVPPPEKPRHFALSRTTDRVLQILLRGDLARLRAAFKAKTREMAKNKRGWK